MNDILDKIPEKSAVLIIGPPLSKKKNLLYSIISKAFNNKKAVLFITTDNFPKDIESSLKENKVPYKKYENLGNLKFIDCYSSQAKNILFSTEVTKRIAGPLALNEISVAISEVESYFFNKNKKPQVIFQSLSTLLMHSKPEAIERFVQVIIARTKNIGGSIFFTIEEGMHDNKVIIAFQHLMDGVIELHGKKLSLKIK